MLAKDFYQKDRETLKRYFNAKLQYIEDKQKANKEVDDFFEEKADMEYNDFLNALQDKYGNVLSKAKEEGFDKTEKEVEIEKTGLAIGGTIQIIGLIITIIFIIWLISSMSSL